MHQPSHHPNITYKEAKWKTIDISAKSLGHKLNSRPCNPVVPNPHTLLPRVSLTREPFSVVGFTVPFLWCPFAPNSYFYFLHRGETAVYLLVFTDSFYLRDRQGILRKDM